MSAQPIMRSGGVSNQSIYTVTTSPRQRIGEGGYLPDGRVFYYTMNTTAAALTIGELQVQADIAANHQNLATATTSLAVGSQVVTDVTLGATAAAVDIYQEGYLHVASDGGAGQMFQIREHAAIASAGTGDFQIYGAVAVASDASTTVSLTKNLYRDPQQSNLDQADVLVGVPVVTIPVGSTTTQYGWLQTYGPCPVLCDESVAAFGQCIVPGTSIVGAVEEDDTVTTVSQEPIVGWNMTALVDTEHQLVDLRIRGI